MRSLRATDAMVRLYRAWAEGGAGLLISGNVMIDRRVLERPGNVATIRDAGRRDDDAAAQLGQGRHQSNGNHLWMQITHAGRQSPWYVTGQPLARSAVQLKRWRTTAGRGRCARGDPRFIQRYAAGGAHGARGGLHRGCRSWMRTVICFSCFLSPSPTSALTLGRRLENARASCGSGEGDAPAWPDFPVGLKLNSADFQKGGFSSGNVCRCAVANDCGLESAEISGHL